jgi:cytochrome P450
LLKKYVLTIDLVNGGADGPAISLACTLYYLAKYPEKLAKLREELDSALSPSDTVTPWSKVKNLAYLRACVNESMRLAPPVATDLVRKTPPAGARIDDQIVPGDTVVSISAYTAHRDPEVFPDPEAFLPERWLMKGDDRLREMLAVFIPFSAGSRSCIGRNITILEQLVFVATLCYRYEFALPSKEWEMEFEDYFNLWPVNLPMKIWRREVQTAA